MTANVIRCAGGSRIRSDQTNELFPNRRQFHYSDDHQTGDHRSNRKKIPHIFFSLFLWFHQKSCFTLPARKHGSFVIIFLPSSCHFSATDDWERVCSALHNQKVKRTSLSYLISRSNTVFGLISLSNKVSWQHVCLPFLFQLKHVWKLFHRDVNEKVKELISKKCELIEQKTVAFTMRAGEIRWLRKWNRIKFVIINCSYSYLNLIANTRVEKKMKSTVMVWKFWQRFRCTNSQISTNCNFIVKGALDSKNRTRFEVWMDKGALIGR